MRKQRPVQIAAVVLAMVLPSCSLQYNSTVGSKDRDQEYQQFKEELARQRATGEQRPGEQRPGEQRSAENGEVDDLAQGAAGRLAVRDSADREARFVSEPSPAAHRPGMSPLSLYGQLPEGQPALSSPLDGPDNIVQFTFANEGADFDPAIDPTGTWIAFASTQHRRTSDIYLKRIDGNTVTQLTSDPGNDVMPAFSPDGQRIAFASDRSGSWDIYLMDVNGGQPIKITDGPSQDLHPSFSPDGSQLVYCSYGAQSGQWELVVVDVANPSTRQFVGNGLFPKWSPVDNRIVFQRARERGSRWFSIWTIELVDGQAMRPTEIASSTNAAVITPDWSPDGSYLVFCTVIDPLADEGTRPTQADVWIIAADGTGRANLTRSRFANLQPVWSPQGTIFFVSNRGRNGQENIWAVRPDSALRLVESQRERAREASVHVPVE